MIVMTVLLTVASNSYKGIYVDYYQKLAEEAAEAGTAYATACLNLSAHVQTWGPAAGASNLTPNVDCNGANTYSTNLYVHNDSKSRTYFTVADLDYSVQFAAQVSARGYSQVLRPDGSVKQTYTSIMKKIITWPVDVGAVMTSSGTNRTCSIVNHSVYCWGHNGFGQLGNGQYIGGSTSLLESESSIDSKVPVRVYRGAGAMANKQMVKVFAAQYHSCALSSDGLMFCWGHNAQGQLGTGDTTDSPVPVQVAGALVGKTITDIGGTGNVTCAISEGKIYCWGRNTSGQVGLGYANTTLVTSPTLVSATDTATTLPTTYTATALTSGSRSNTTCAIANGKAFCWGHNQNGGIGDGTTTQRNLPTKTLESGVLSGKTITSISQDGYVSEASGGYSHTCVVADGTAYCWGDNLKGQLGDGTTVDSPSPVAVVATGVLSGKTIQAVYVGLTHSCVRANSGAYCWGNNVYGQIGDSTTTSRVTPVAVSQVSTALTASNVVSLGGGGNRGCAVITDGRTFCWGLNSSGQIGDGTTITRTSPTESLFVRPLSNQYIF
jgi:alpha-tubulin suppressor-like RCC1 family protein